MDAKEVGNDNQKPWFTNAAWQNALAKPAEDPGNITSKTSANSDSQLYGLVLPVAAAGTSLLVLCAIAVAMYLLKRKKALVGDANGPSIVVYPSGQGASPQFLTRDILFSLPPLRHSSSLDDFGVFDDDSDLDTDSLVAAARPHSQRSNSFSCYGLGVIDPALYGSCTAALEEELCFPDGHLGRLWFSVRYESATEKLLVSILKAKNLPSRTVGTVNGCDPFVRLHLIPDERRYLQSKMRKKTCNPFFDETFVFQIAAKQLLNHVLRLTVIDSGRPKLKGVIGHVILPLRNVTNEAEPQTFKMDLEKEAQENVTSDLGEVLVSLLYNEYLNRLSVTVVEARRLKLKDGDKQDTYVKIILSQNYRPVKVKKTSVARGKADPSFSQCFNFRIAPESSDVSSLSFHVYQTVFGYGRDRLIGKFVLGSHMFARGRANTHWTSAFSNPKEAFQQWHPLSG